GDERRQAVDIACALMPARLRLALRLLLMLRKGLCIARQIRLWLPRAERRFTVVCHRLVIEAAFVRIIKRFFTGVVVGTCEVRIILTELLLRGSDQPEIMFGMLVIVLGRNGIAG